MNDRWERLIDLYHSAVSLPADERATLLAEECGDDPGSCVGDDLTDAMQQAA